MSTFIPSKVSKRHKVPPWINKRVKRMHKRRAYNTHRRLNTAATYESFCTLRKETHRVTRDAYRKHVKNICLESPKKFYGFIKSLRVDTVGIPALSKNGSLVSDNKTKADILNDQFCSVFTEEHPEVPVVGNAGIPPWNPSP